MREYLPSFSRSQMTSAKNENFDKLDISKIARYHYPARVSRYPARVSRYYMAAKYHHTIP